MDNLPIRNITINYYATYKGIHVMDKILALSVSLFIAGNIIANWKAVKGGLSMIRQCVVTWPMQQTVTILVLAVLGTAWVVGVLLSVWGVAPGGAVAVSGLGPAAVVRRS